MQISRSESGQSAPRRVWGVGTGRTLRPIWTLIELGLEYEIEPIATRTPDMNRPDFGALSDRGKIPLYQEGDFVIGESAAICLYLADAHRESLELAPQPATPERARHDELCFYAMTEMDAILYTIRRHEGLPEVYGEAENAVLAARAYFLRGALEIEDRLEDGRPHLLGEEFTIADLLVKTCLDWAVFLCRIELPAGLDSYSARIATRPAYQTAMKENFPPELLAALPQIQD